MSDDVSSRLRLMTPPAQEPATLSEAKLFLRIEHDADDAVIMQAIISSRQACEQYLGHALLPQAWEYTSRSACRGQVKLPFGAANAIDSVTLIDDLGIETELGETDYRLSIDGFSVFLDVPTEKAIRIAYDASMADDAASLPALLKQGIMHHVAAMLDQREGLAPMPIAVLQCYQPFRRVRL